VREHGRARESTREGGGAEGEADSPLSREPNAMRAGSQDPGS